MGQYKGNFVMSQIHNVTVGDHVLVKRPVLSRLCAQKTPYKEVEYKIVSKCHTRGYYNDENGQQKVFAEIILQVINRNGTKQRIANAARKVIGKINPSFSCDQTTRECTICHQDLTDSQDSQESQNPPNPQDSKLSNMIDRLVALWRIGGNESPPITTIIPIAPIAPITPIAPTKSTQSARMSQISQLFDLLL